MQAIEFTADLASALDDFRWRRAAYEHFARDDAPEDAVYDNYEVKSLANQHMRL